MHETVDVTGSKVGASNSRDEVHGHLDGEVHLSEPGQGHCSQDPVESGTLHVFVGIRGGVPIESDTPQKGGAATTHGKVVPLVQFVRSLLKVFGHEEIGLEKELETEDGHEDGASLEGIFGG